MTRTHDLLITNQLHYRLCYTSIYYNRNIITEKNKIVKFFLKKVRKNLQKIRIRVDFGGVLC